MSSPPPTSTDAAYAARLRRGESVWWKRLLDVQRPYRMHLQHLKLGRVLDVGCGIGRNLSHCDARSVGVDPNVDGVATCRARGLTAYTPEQFVASGDGAAGSFDTLLISHVLEHLPAAGALGLVTEYLPYVRAGGRAVFITPQEAGYRTDATHVEFVDHAKLEHLATHAGLSRTAAYSFPFPRRVGRWFRYNEFVLIAHKA